YTWSTINQALIKGTRGLPAGDSLRKLLKRERGLGKRLNVPGLTEEQILDWAKAHHDRTGSWPVAKSGQPVLDAPGETWLAIQHSLAYGLRGLPGGTSLSRLLDEHVREPQARP